MAFNPFGRERERGAAGPIDTTTPPSAPAVVDSTPMASLSAFIDQGTEFEGRLTFRDTVRIDGRFVGEITSENTLIVGETGEVEAEVDSQVVIVGGTVVGPVKARRRLVLHKTARLEGDVEVGSLAIEDGAVLNGRVTMVTTSVAERGSHSLPATASVAEG
ncbi:MAG TPA: polymer-forming cytoskeletal protein [Myxococcota bacterium]|jgi:cytoskeletal protein CcmA (bactofilin family)|nr:polymer-forming cytoskeletal protein [Myxococcota bacterium]